MQAPRVLLECVERPTGADPDLLRVLRLARPAAAAGARCRPAPRPGRGGSPADPPGIHPAVQSSAARHFQAWIATGMVRIDNPCLMSRLGRLFHLDRCEQPLEGQGDGGLRGTAGDGFPGTSASLLDDRLLVHPEGRSMSRSASTSWRSLVRTATRAAAIAVGDEQSAVPSHADVICPGVSPDSSIT